MSGCHDVSGSLKIIETPGIISRTETISSRTAQNFQLICTHNLIVVIYENWTPVESQG